MKTIMSRLLVSLILLGLLTACVPASGASVSLETEEAAATLTDLDLPTSLPSETASPQPTNTVTSMSTHDYTATPDIRLNPADWQNWPIVPTVSARAKAIYAEGLEKGHNPTRFSKIGDCQNIIPYFLGFFDSPERYDLGEKYAYLQEAIDYFSGSFSRESAATKGGMNVAAVFSQYWADQERCDVGESPLACELRLHQPSMVIISMEESWGRNNKVENYEKYMRQIIETVIEFGAVPILATKADNMEGDHLINQTIARLSYEYDIPLWNFWRAVQPLENHGLEKDGFHLTGMYHFTKVEDSKLAWPIRNMTALQAIDSVWRQLNDLPLPPTP